MKKGAISLLIISGIGLVIILAGWAFISFQKEFTGPTPLPGRAPMIVWQAQDTQTSTESQDGKFNIRGYLVIPKSILFFYTMQTLQTSEPQIVATSDNILNTGERLASPLTVTKVQSLRKIGSFETGVIQVNWSNKAGQIISLQITAPNTNSLIGKVDPLKQLAPDQNNEQVTFHAVVDEPSAVKIENGASGGPDNYGVFKVSLPEQPTIAPFFFKVDRQATIQPITQTEYKTLTAPMPTTRQPNGSIDGYRATPAPTRA